MSVFFFPGQGSQKRGMGQELFDEVNEFVAVEHQIDQCLGYSVRKLCLEDTDNRLKETQYTQPCLYVVNALHYYKAVLQGERPSFLAGHSVGEYNALLAAGAFDFLTGLRLVQKRGELMAQAKNGGMAAVIGLNASHIPQVFRENGLSSLDIANYNSPLQTVISGPLDEIKRAGPIFEKAGARLYFPLPVSAAFHSRYMVEASEAFARFLASFSFMDLKIPVISNVTGHPYPEGHPSATIRSLLVRQMTRPVRWMQTVRYLLEKGATSFKELGPGTVLTKLAQKIEQETEMPPLAISMSR